MMITLHFWQQSDKSLLNVLILMILTTNTFVASSMEELFRSILEICQRNSFLQVMMLNYFFIVAW